jgi:hypothetical protein
MDRTWYSVKDIDLCLSGECSCLISSASPRLVKLKVSKYILSAFSKSSGCALEMSCMHCVIYTARVSLRPLCQGKGRVQL